MASPQHTLLLDLRERDEAALEQPWLSRSTRTEIMLPLDHEGLRLQIELRSGDDDLYRYFPFSVWIEADSGHQEICEFSSGNQTRTLSIAIPHRARWRGKAVIEIHSELGGVPRLLGKSEDERELALRLVSVRRRSAENADGPGRPLGDFTRPPAMKFGAAPAPRPIFVVGSYRSGTSVLTWAIGQHPNIWAIDETGWMPELLLGAELAFRQSSNRPTSFWGVYQTGRDNFLEWLGRSIDAWVQECAQERAFEMMLRRLSNTAPDYNPAFQLIRSRWNPKRRWVDGTPENTLYMLLLADAFPEAQFILLVRDPRDVVASLMKFSAAGAQDYAIEDACAAWLRLTRGGLGAVSALGPERVKVVLYETLKDATQDTLNDLWRFLDEPLFQASADVFKTRINSSKTDASDAAALPTTALAEASALYERVRTNAWQEPDLGARERDKFSAWLNDLVSRRNT